MSAITNRPISTYRDFWPYYLQEHARPATRNLHFLGTGLALACLLAALATGKSWLGLVALLAGYGPAWIAHFFVEKNRPATFTYPLWSLVSDSAWPGSGHRPSRGRAAPGGRRSLTSR